MVMWCMVSKCQNIKDFCIVMSSRNPLFIAILSAFILVGCATAGEHRKNVQDNTGDKVTVGTVQKEIKQGMSGAEVAAALGSPNIVSTDEKRREVWIYDKISTDRVFSTSGAKTGVLPMLIIGGGASQSGAASTSQRTLTVIIKFDEQKMVRDFAYHTSRF